MNKTVYIAIAGEPGSGKTKTANKIQEILEKEGINAMRPTHHSSRSGIKKATELSERNVVILEDIYDTDGILSLWEKSIYPSTKKAVKKFLKERNGKEWRKFYKKYKSIK